MLLMLFTLCHAGKYIVLYKQPDNTSEINEKMAYEDSYSHIMTTYGGSIHLTNKLRNGFIGEFDEQTKNSLQTNERIKMVEKDSTVSISQTKIENVEFLSPIIFLSKEENIKMQKNAPWGISRISNGASYTNKNTYLYPSNAGQNVDVYVIDTGIEVSHKEFKDRARWGINLVENSPDTDDHGHGTHCAGVIAGKNTGIAKNAHVIGVKALDMNGNGLISRLMIAIDYVIQEHELKKEILEEQRNIKRIEESSSSSHAKVRHMKRLVRQLKRMFKKKFNKRIMRRNKKGLLINEHTVVNMSVGGGKSGVLEYAIEYASKQGIHFSVAAGNDHRNACSYSPGSSKKVLTVGATTPSDQVAFFSNYGECVKIFAPGVGISSSWIGDSYKIATGTSMAAPHVSGIMAVYLSEKNYYPRELMEQIIKDSYEVIVDGEGKGGLQGTWPFSLVFNIKKYPLASLRPLLKRIRNR